MLRDKAIISQIGCKDLSNNLLVSIFNLSPGLRDVYQEPDPDETRAPDLVFVDADVPECRKQFEEMKAKIPTLTGVMITSGDKAVGKFVTLKRPLTFKKLLYALKVTTASSISSDAGVIKGDAMRILVVDDSLPVRKFLEHKLPELTSEQITIDFAASGEEGARKVKQASPEYDLVFLDVVMPGADGYKVCKWIKANHPTYVVMLTSKKSPFDKVRGAMSGCNDYLTKPPEEDKLKKVLQKAFNEIDDSRKQNMTSAR